MSNSGKQNTKYREAAERIYGPLVRHKCKMQVSHFGGVYPVEGGAFVEVQVFVPDSELATDESKS